MPSRKEGRRRIGITRESSSPLTAKRMGISQRTSSGGARVLAHSYLADSILVIVECSKLTGRAREDLFMNSRDRLSGVDWLRPELERALEDMLSTIRVCENLENAAVGKKSMRRSAKTDPLKISSNHLSRNHLLLPTSLCADRGPLTRSRPRKSKPKRNPS